MKRAHCHDTMDASFREAIEQKIKQKTIDILEENDIDDFSILHQLSVDDLEKMGITKGQAIALRTLAEKNVKDPAPARRDESPMDIPEPSGAISASGQCRVNQDISRSWISSLPGIEDFKRHQEGASKGASNTVDMETFDLEKYDSKLKADLDIFGKQPVHVAITGQSGQGKSSLVNSLMNLRPDELGAAEVGTVECTMSEKRYNHPDKPDLFVYDLPGYNTVRVPMDTYVETFHLANFDAVLICISSRVFDTDLSLAEVCRKKSVPFYFVRTKIDQDLENSKEDYPGNFDEQQILTNLRDDIVKQFRGRFSEDDVYLVSSKIVDQTKWDMPRLQVDIISKVAKKNTAALVLDLTATSKNVIDMKYGELSGRISKIATRAAMAGDPMSIVKDEVELYRSKFGLLEKNLDKWNVDRSELEMKSKTLLDQLDDLDKTLRQDKNSLKALKDAPPGESTIGRDIGVKIFGVGYVFGAAFDAVVNTIQGYQMDNKIKAAEDSLKEKEDEVMEFVSDLLTEILNMYKALSLDVLEARQQVYLQ